MFCFRWVNTVSELKGLFELGVFLDRSDLIEWDVDCVKFWHLGFKQKGLSASGERYTGPIGLTYADAEM